MRGPGGGHGGPGGGFRGRMPRRGIPPFGGRPPKGPPKFGWSPWYPRFFYGRPGCFGCLMTLLSFIALAGIALILIF